MKKPKRKQFPYIPESIFDHENWGGDDEHNFDKTNTVEQILFKIFMGVVLIGLILTIANVVEYRIVNNKCISLEEQSKEFEHFFITYWQKEMCDYHGFTFMGTEDAPIHVDSIPEGEKLQVGFWYTDNVYRWVADINYNYLKE